MKSNIMKRYQKSKYKIFDFGRGKTKTSKKRHRKFIKRNAKNRFNKDYPMEY